MHDDIEYIEMPRWVVRGLDHILAHWEKAGSKYAVESTKDWEIVRSIWKLWKTAYPHEYEDFTKKIKKTRQAHLNKYGASGGSADNGQVRHIADIPGRFERMFKIFYPNQTFSKPFLRKLIKHIPELKAPDKI